MLVYEFMKEELKKWSRTAGVRTVNVSGKWEANNGKK